MSAVPPVRPDLDLGEGYHSPQVEAEVRLNTNESPFAPPDEWREEFLAALADTSFHRYPDRPATELRQAVADLHGVRPEEIFCANGSNEVLQSLLLAFGGPGRRAAGLRAHLRAALAHRPRHRDRGGRGRRATTTSRSTPPTRSRCCLECARHHVPLLAEQPHRARGATGDGRGRGGGRPRSGGRGRGLRAVLALERADLAWSGQPGLVVTRTFSKTWALAGARLGYLVADPAVVLACEAVVLPYHLSVQTQLAGLLALRHLPEMEARVARITEERGRVAAGLADLPVDSWPSDANFILFRPARRDADDVWRALLEHSILIGTVRAGTASRAACASPSARRRRMSASCTR